MSLIKRRMRAEEVRVADRLLNEDGKPIVVSARTTKGQTKIVCGNGATINVPARTPMGEVQRQNREEVIEVVVPYDEMLASRMPQFTEPPAQRIELA